MNLIEIIFTSYLKNTSLIYSPKSYACFYESSQFYKFQNFLKKQNPKCDYNLNKFEENVSQMSKHQKAHNSCLSHFKKFDKKNHFFIKKAL